MLRSELRWVMEWRESEWKRRGRRREGGRETRRAFCFVLQLLLIVARANRKQQRDIFPILHPERRLTQLYCLNS